QGSIRNFTIEPREAILNGWLYDKTDWVNALIVNQLNKADQLTGGGFRAMTWSGYILMMDNTAVIGEGATTILYEPPRATQQVDPFVISGFYEPFDDYLPNQGLPPASAPQHQVHYDISVRDLQIAGLPDLRRYDVDPNSYIDADLLRPP